jgi:hypothetical protein
MPKAGNVPHIAHHTWYHPLCINASQEAIDQCDDGKMHCCTAGLWRQLPVAIKAVIFQTAEQQLARAVSEAAIACSLSHENIVSTYSHDIVQVEGDRSLATCSAQDIEPGVYELHLIQVCLPDSTVNPPPATHTEQVHWDPSTFTQVKMAAYTICVHPNVQIGQLRCIHRSSFCYVA